MPRRDSPFLRRVNAERAKRFQRPEVTNPLLRHVDDEKLLSARCGPQKKYVYPTHAAAKKAKKTSLKIYGSIVYVYKCPRCNLYHLTSQPQQPKEKT